MILCPRPSLAPPWPVPADLEVMYTDGGCRSVNGADSAGRAGGASSSYTMETALWTPRVNGFATCAAPSHCRCFRPARPSLARRAEYRGSDTWPECMSIDGGEYGKHSPRTATNEGAWCK